MRIKIYIVTYKNDSALKMCLGSLLASDITDYDYSIHIVNNYGSLQGFDEDRITVLDNLCRPDHCHGYLARNWNQCIVDGFKDLNNPDCDIVILIQNDTIIKSKCFSELIKSHEIYDFIQAGAGDQLMSFTPNAIKNIGLFDERFCKVLQEADYFWSATTFHEKKSSINDAHHSRVLNPVDKFTKWIGQDWSQRTGMLGAGERFIEFAFAFFWDFVAIERNDESGCMIQKEVPSNVIFRTKGMGSYNAMLFFTKWGIKEDNQEKRINSLPIKENRMVMIDRHFIYPYFEKDILTLKEQRYLFADEPALMKDVF